ncbi:MAG: hypothetical protein M1822_004987 [Bathelium mastoideum]|nr:MAG: hypothetical protein M1822_004987 [Bathelium mastoideum]
MTTSAPPPSVLVLGTGELGTALLHALTTHPLRGSTRIALLLRPATLLSLPHTTLTDLRTRAVDLLPGDLALDNTDQLAATFAHFHTVIGATGMRLPAGTQRKVCAAALQAGVGCYFPWQFGVDYDVIGQGSAQELFGEQVGVREMLRAQEGGRTRWVVVSVGMFMSFLLEAAFGVVERDGGGRVVGVNALGGWDTRVTVTGVEDIGKMVAELVFGSREER